MKLTIYPQKPFVIEKGILTILQTDNPKFYSDLIIGLSRHKNIIVSSNDETIDAKENLVYLDNVISNPNLFLPFKLKLENLIIEDLNENERQKLFQLDREIKSIFLGASYLEDMPMAIDEGWDLKKLYKYSGIDILESAIDNPYDIIRVALNLYKKFYPKKLIVLNDLFNYLNSSQITNLIQMVKDLDLYVLILNFSNQTYSKLFEKCRYCSVDSDFVRFDR